MQEYTALNMAVKKPTLKLSYTIKRYACKNPRVRECPESLKAMIDLANTKRKKRRVGGVSPAEARQKLKRIIAATTERRELDELNEGIRERVLKAAALPDAMEWEKERAALFEPLRESFTMKTDAMLYEDEDGIMRGGFDFIDRAIINEPFSELDRIRECKVCGDIFWAGRATVAGKRVEGCGPNCLNILRLRRREEEKRKQRNAEPSQEEIAAVREALTAWLQVMNKHKTRSDSPWQFEGTSENLDELAERAQLSKDRTKRTVAHPEIQSIIAQQRTHKR
jgi:hypothetical protein